MRTLYVIEARDAEGRLDFGKPQPENIFGICAVTGIDADTMAKRIYAICDDSVTLRGDQVARWPSFVDPRFTARVKTWGPLLTTQREDA